MKKNLLGLILFCCMGLFVSCSNDDNASDVDAGQIRISAIFPESIAADGQSEVAGHKLRCILELWTKGEGKRLAYHSEIVTDPIAEVKKMPIDLTVAPGTYDCFMWVDYIDANAATSIRTEDGASHYEDKYYDTSDLKNITVKDMNSLVNNNACDAFFYSGEIQKKAGEAFILDTELVRPFTKVSVLEKNLREFNLLQGLSVSYNAAAKFDISTGKVVGEEIAVTHTVSVFNPADTPDGTLFSTYIFADEDSSDMDEIHLSFTTKQGVQNVKIPSGLIPLLRNQHVKVSGNMMRESPMETEFDIIFDVDVAEWESNTVAIISRPIKAKVGDFFYADGTYSSSFRKNDANPCIGVVFAVAHDDGKASGDKPENYIANDGTQKLQEIHGWVIALKDVIDGTKRIAPSSNNIQSFDLAQKPAIDLVDNCDEGNKSYADIFGFKNTEIFKATANLEDYPIAKAVSEYGNTTATKAPVGTSGWYWGAVKQYLTLSEEYASKDTGLLTVGKSMQILIEAGVAETFSLDGEQFYWSSSIEKTKSGSQGMLYRVGLLITAKNYGQTAAWRVNDGRHARAILTF